MLTKRLEMDILEHCAQIAVHDAIQGSLRFHPHNAGFLLGRLDLHDHFETGVHLGAGEMLLGEPGRKLSA
jgi:hypothetical protein